MSHHYNGPRPYGYAFHAALYCGQCGYNLPEVDPEGNPKHSILSWELTELNTDYSATCDKCHETTDNWGPAEWENRWT